MKKLCVNYHEKPILNNINWTIKRRIFYLLGPNGSGKSTFFLNNWENKGLWPRSLSLLCKRKWRKHLGYIKKHWLLFNSNDWFISKNDSLEQMVLSGFFDSIGLYTQPSVSKKHSFSVAELVHLNHLKTPFKTLSVGQQRLALIIRAVIKHPIINFRRSRGRTRWWKCCYDFTTNYPFISTNQHSNSIRF
jgi:molybdate transport system ATP-binding protein